MPEHGPELPDEIQAAILHLYFKETTSQLFELLHSARQAAARDDEAEAMELGEQAWQLVNTVGASWQAYVLHLVQVLQLVLEDRPVPGQE